MNVNWRYNEDAGQWMGVATRLHEGEEIVCSRDYIEIVYVDGELPVEVEWPRPHKFYLPVGVTNEQVIVREASA